MSDLDSFLPAILAGDVDAFGYWVAGAEARLRNSLRHFAAVVDTEAVVQETLLRVWQVAPRFVSDGRHMVPSSSENPCDENIRANRWKGRPQRYLLTRTWAIIVGAGIPRSTSSLGFLAVTNVTTRGPLCAWGGVASSGGVTDRAAGGACVVAGVARGSTAVSMVTGGARGSTAAWAVTGEASVGAAGCGDDL